MSNLWLPSAILNKAKTLSTKVKYFYKLHFYYISFFLVLPIEGRGGGMFTSLFIKYSRSFWKATSDLSVSFPNYRVLLSGTVMTVILTLQEPFTDTSENSIASFTHPKETFNFKTVE